MAKFRHLVIGGLLGASLAYFLDPDLGPARRARVLGQLETAIGQIRGAGATASAAGSRATAQVAADDLTLLSRVESVFQGLSGFPHSSVTAEVVDSGLIIRGEVASEEQAEHIVGAAGRVPGVTSVENRLRVRREPAPERPRTRQARAPHTGS